MLDRSQFSFLPPSAGDQLLAGASQAKLTLTRFVDPDGEEPPGCCVEFELKGELQLAGPAASSIVRDMLREFRTPRQEGGAK